MRIKWFTSGGGFTDSSLPNVEETVKEHGWESRRM